jgi:hypothetical protein
MEKTRGGVEKRFGGVFLSRAGVAPAAGEPAKPKAGAGDSGSGVAQPRVEEVSPETRFAKTRFTNVLAFFSADGKSFQIFFCNMLALFCNFPAFLIAGAHRPAPPPPGKRKTGGQLALPAG